MSKRLRWYLAGRIEEYDDWRLSLVDGLEARAKQWRSAYGEDLGGCDRLPVMENAIWNNWDYVGPYFAYDMGHSGDAHARFVHGYDDGEHGRLVTPDNHGMGMQREVHSLCLQAVADCDALFAWIVDPHCHGTLIEIGYALALKKETYVAFRRQPRGRPSLTQDMWFAGHSAAEVVECDTAADGFQLIIRLKYTREIEAELRSSKHELQRASVNEAAVALQAIDILPVRLDPQRAFSGLQKKEILLRSNGHCVVCGVDLGLDWHADHIFPHARGGRTEVVNGQALCQSCNQRKHAKVLTVDGP